MDTNKLLQIQILVKREDCLLSEHVIEKVEENQFTVDDVDECIINGQISNVQQDEKRQSIDGKKYTITGTNRAGNKFESVGKLIETDEGQIYYVITAYRRISK